MRRQDVQLLIDNDNDTVFRCWHHLHYPIIPMERQLQYTTAIVKHHASDVYTDRHPSYIRVRSPFHRQFELGRDGLLY